MVQLGATRDGLDPYLECARRREMPTVLVETPQYLDWRRALRRRPFDLELAVPRPDQPAQVAAALRAAGVRPGLLLAGFERYVAAGIELARRLGVAPWPAVGEGFAAPQKAEQRDALAAGGLGVRQPRYLRLDPGGAPAADLGTLCFPQVVKPVDGGGGLGVFLVGDAGERSRAIAANTRLRNYGGGEFGGLLVEEFVEGVEHSVQGLAINGRAVVLTTCTKIVVVEQGRPGDPRGFRELGHICQHGAAAPEPLRELSQRALDLTGYREGPFHLDAIWGPDGPEFIEMGFRLSGGGLVALMARASGLDWAELTFAAHLGEPVPVPGAAPAAARVVGQVNLRDAGELAAAEELCCRLPDAELRRLGPWPAHPAAEAGDPLASDWLRHTGTVGRVIITGSTTQEVLVQLESCLRERDRRSTGCVA